MEIGPLFKEMRASLYRPGSPAQPLRPPTTSLYPSAPAEPHPHGNVCYISRCRRSPVCGRCQLVSARSLAELAAGVIKLQTAFRPAAAAAADGGGGGGEEGVGDGSGSSAALEIGLGLGLRVSDLEAFSIESALGLGLD